VVVVALSPLSVALVRRPRLSPFSRQKQKEKARAVGPFSTLVPCENKQDGRTAFYNGARGEERGSRGLVNADNGGQSVADDD
jgi:hypothetical protein